MFNSNLCVFFSLLFVYLYLCWCLWFFIFVVFFSSFLFLKLFNLFIIWYLYLFVQCLYSVWRLPSACLGFFILVIFLIFLSFYSFIFSYFYLFVQCLYFVWRLPSACPAGLPCQDSCSAEGSNTRKTPEINLKRFNKNVWKRTKKVYFRAKTHLSLAACHTKSRNTSIWSWQNGLKTNLLKKWCWRLTEDCKTQFMLETFDHQRSVF